MAGRQVSTFIRAVAIERRALLTWFIAPEETAPSRPFLLLARGGRRRWRIRDYFRRLLRRTHFLYQRTAIVGRRSRMLLLLLLLTAVRFVKAPVAVAGQAGRLGRQIGRRFIHRRRVARQADSGFVTNCCHLA